MSVLNEFSDICRLKIFEDNKSSKEALNYLIEHRGLTVDTIKRLKLGYCSQDMYLEQGIRQYGGRIDKDYSYCLKDRIIVPIFEEFGKEVVGIGTRKPVDEKFPWWNSPYPFQKGNHLYNLNKARKSIFERNKAYIVEGYMDAIILYQAGIKNVVAVMGTKLTLRHIGLLTRYCEKFCFCFDVDENNSGQNARDASIVSTNQLGICKEMTKIDSMPEGEDPASFVKKFGKDSFLALEEEVPYEKILEIIDRLNKSKKKGRKNGRK